MPNNNFNFAIWLRKEMDHAGWDDLDLAIAADISEKTIQHYLHGDWNPTLNYFLRIVNAFGKHIEIGNGTGNKWTI